MVTITAQEKVFQVSKELETKGHNFAGEVVDTKHSVQV